MVNPRLARAGQLAGDEDSALGGPGRVSRMSPWGVLLLALGPHSKLEESAEPAEIQRTGMAQSFMSHTVLYLLFSSAPEEGAVGATDTTTVACHIQSFSSTPAVCLLSEAHPYRHPSTLAKWP